LLLTLLFFVVKNLNVKKITMFYIAYVTCKISWKIRIFK